MYNTSESGHGRFTKEQSVQQYSANSMKDTLPPNISQYLLEGLRTNRAGRFL